MKKFFALLVAVLMLLCSFTAVAEEAGFDEYPIGPEEDNEKILSTDGISMAVAMVYFQPVEMEPVGMALSLEDSNLHIEADIQCLENELGYGVGDWIPYLTINYVIKDADGNVVTDGSFMPMAASDGPHYGANIFLEKAGTYSVTLTILSPAENGYLLHVDEETGVGGRFWTEPLTATWENWDYVPQW